MYRRHPIARTAAILGAGLLIAGCGGDRMALEQKIEEQTHRIEQLNAELLAAHESHAEATEALRIELTEAHQRKLDDLGSTLRRQINDYSRTISGLRQQLEAAERPSPAPPSPAPAATPRIPPPVPATPIISVYTPPQPEVDHFIVPPDDPGADLFPVHIDSIQGERVVVGSHTSTRGVETGEMVKDKFGNEKPLIRPELIEVQDYDHQARFTAHNRTRNPVTFTYRAGRDRKTITLEGGGSEDCRVSSIVGASLTVHVGSETRSFPVAYP